MQSQLHGFFLEMPMIFFRGVGVVGTDYYCDVTTPTQLSSPPLTGRDFTEVESVARWQPLSNFFAGIFAFRGVWNFT